LEASAEEERQGAVGQKRSGMVNVAMAAVASCTLEIGS